MTTFRLKIADHPVEFRLPSDKLLESMQDRYGGFLTTEVPSTVFDVSFSERAAAPIDIGVIEAFFDEKDVRYCRNDLLVTMDEELREGKVIMRENLLTLDALLRIFYSILLIRTGGLLLHAASVGLDGAGALFIGKPESGKSELSQMVQGEHLTDELSPVRPSDHDFLVYGSPFWGLFATGGINAGLPAKAALFLFRDTQTRIEPAAGRILLRSLLRCVLNFSKESGVAERVVRNCVAFLEAVPSARLFTPPAPELWPLVRAFIESQET